MLNKLIKVSMCGIFAILSNDSISQPLPEKECNLIAHRGPDHSSIQQVTPSVILGFHRLAINDLTENGNQPITHPDHPSSWVICNGEIYNHKDLVAQYHLSPRSGSDCEVILLLYHKVGIVKTLQLLDGYFALVLVDHDEVYTARDPIGVRSLYWGRNEHTVCFASEMKAIHSLAEDIQLFPPSSYWSRSTNTTQKYKDLLTPRYVRDSYEMAVVKTRMLLEKAVQKRVDNTERPFGCLLSGGLDSSIITALVQRYSLQKTGKAVHTFSIGMEGSTDVRYARKVAEHLKTIHHEIIVTKEDMLEEIPNVIRSIESYDTTTVRASTPMWMLARYIKHYTDIRVIFSGEGSDELSGSYLYFYKAPSLDEFYDETLRLTEELHYFDVLRADKSISAHGLEARVPFLDQEFISYYLHLRPEYKIPNELQCEKKLLRTAFEDLLPAEVAWRTKEAFSDGVSHKEESWYEIIQKHVENVELGSTEYDYLPPMMKETMWYRMLFDKCYKGREKVLPHYWLPKWSGQVADPSARTLKVYDDKVKSE